jgi:hypothetical protein
MSDYELVQLYYNALCDARPPAASRKGFSHATREVCFPSGMHPPYTYITAGTIRRSFTYGG